MPDPRFQHDDGVIVDTQPDPAFVEILQNENIDGGFGEYDPFVPPSIDADDDSGWFPELCIDLHGRASVTWYVPSRLRGE